MGGRKPISSTVSTIFNLTNAYLKVSTGDILTTVQSNKRTPSHQHRGVEANLAAAKNPRDIHDEDYDMPESEHPWAHLWTVEARTEMRKLLSHGVRLARVANRRAITTAGESADGPSPVSRRHRSRNRGIQKILLQTGLRLFTRLENI
jgi:hypothetical protein